MTIHTCHKNKNYLKSLQRQINTLLEEWCQKWFIKLNSKKTQLILFRPQIKQKPVITMGGDRIKTTDKATFLGATLDPRLNMIANLNAIKQKIAPRIMKLIELRNWGQPDTQAHLPENLLSTLTTHFVVMCRVFQLCLPC